MMPSISMRSVIYVLLGLLCVLHAVLSSILFEGVTSPQINDGMSSGQFDQHDAVTLTSYTDPYCNHHYSIDGEEGEMFDGFVLKQVHLLLTPGQTDQHMDGRADPQSCDVTADAHNSPKLDSFQETVSIYKMVQQNRHGFKEFHPVFGRDCSNHYLTIEGYKQSVLIGEHLYHSYYNNSSHKLFLDSSRIHVNSVPEPASYQSLLSFLHGLLPEKEFAKTKVHKTLSNFCSTSKSNLPSCHCSFVEEQAPFVMNAAKKGRYMFKDAFPDRDKLVQLFGSELGSSFSSFELYENMKMSKCNGSSSFCLNGICTNLTSDKERILSDLVSIFLKKLRRDSIFQQFSKLNTYPFLERLVQQSSDRSMTGSVSVYMGDEQFLEQLKSSLAIIHGDLIPSIATRLVFELYQRNLQYEDGGQWFVRVVSDGREVMLGLPGCEGGWPEGLCPVDVLVRHVTGLRQQYLQECDIH